MCEECGEGSCRPDVERETGVIVEAAEIGVEDIGGKLELGLFDCDEG